MSENAAEWERIGRQLLHDDLIYHATKQIEQAFWDVAEDIQNGHEVTVRHLEHLARAFHEVLYFIQDCLVPLVDEIDPDELTVLFELKARPEAN